MYDNTALLQKRYTLGLLSATNPKAKTHMAQALHRVQNFRFIQIKFVEKCTDVESEGPSRAAGGGLVDRLPVRGAFVAFLCVCTSVPALSWGQYRQSTSLLPFHFRSVRVTLNFASVCVAFLLELGLNKQVCSKLPRI